MMKHDGSFTIHCDGGDEFTMPHGNGVGLMRLLDRMQRRPLSTPHGQALVLPMAMLIRRLNDLPAGMRMPDLNKAIDLARLDRLQAGRSTSASIAMGTLDASADTGIERPENAGFETVHDAADDPVLAALMRRHGVERIARTMPGIDAFWGGMEERAASFGSPNPYVRYAGLPDGFPPFLLRPACPGHDSCVAIRLGGGAADVLYCNQGGGAWLGTAQQLPETVLGRMTGRPATDLVGDPALEGFVITDQDAQAYGEGTFALERRT